MEEVKKTTKPQWLPGIGEVQINRAQDFYSSENTLCDTIMMDTWHYTCVPTLSFTLRMIPDVNY